jgi:hypothetical protein
MEIHSALQALGVYVSVSRLRLSLYEAEIEVIMAKREGKRGMSEWRQSEHEPLMLVAPDGKENYWWKMIPRINALELAVEALQAKAALVDEASELVTVVASARMVLGAGPSECCIFCQSTVGHGTVDGTECPGAVAAHWLARYAALTASP